MYGAKRSSKVAALTKLESLELFENLPDDQYWFSGSGNTLRAAEIFAERLRELVWTVDAMRHLIGFRPYHSEPPKQLHFRFEKEIDEETHPAR